MAGAFIGDEPGLVGYWPMDDGVGNVLEDLVGGNDGTISGAAWDATTASFDCCPAG